MSALPKNDYGVPWKPKNTKRPWVQVSRGGEVEMQQPASPHPTFPFPNQVLYV